MTLPETRYAKNNGLHVAYQLVGDGPIDAVLLTQWFSNVDSQWDVPPLAEFIGRLARFGRVLTFDKRGTGLSDPVPATELPSIEEWMDDLRAVLDENAIERAVLIANLASSFKALVFAATYPSRVRALVLVNAYPRFTQTADYPWGFDAAQIDMVADRTRRTWGKGILFTDIVGSTRLAAEHGDRAWRELLERHHQLVRGELARFRGREVDTAGDGFLAVFDGPGRAVRCASAAVRGVQSLGIEIRAGLHTGEVELTNGDVRGIAVNIGARVGSAAGPGEVLVSRTVTDLVAGSGIAFADRGVHSLKGVPGEWQLYAVE